MVLWVISLLNGITNAFGQNEGYIIGQLIDAEKNEAIPFATIRIKDKAVGVISNVDGTFKVPLEFKEIGEVLEISCLGYQTLLVELSTLMENEVNIVPLKPSAFELQEVVVSAEVKSLSAVQIVKNAIKNIPQNYPQSAFGLSGYYRDYQVSKGSYTNLNEALIQLKDLGFSKEDNSQNIYRLSNYKKNTDFKTDVWAKKPYDYTYGTKIVPHAKMENSGGNELLTLFAHDAIRNYKKESFSYIDKMEKDFIKKHEFRVLGETNFNQERVYQIGFFYNNAEYAAVGNIYIAVEDFAILKLDYSLYRIKDEPLSIMVVNPLDRFSDGFNRSGKNLLYHILTEYTRGFKGRMYLNYISFYNKILIQRPAAFKSRVAIDLSDNSFKVALNQVPSNLGKIKLGDFRLRYKGISIPLKDFWYREDERTFVLCPHLGYAKPKVQKIFDVLFEKQDDLSVKDFTYDYRNIEDELGNRLDDRKWEYIHQYREFFVQETSYAESSIPANEHMLHSLPLDSPEQRVLEDDLNKNYWMNTPLKKSINKRP